MANTEEYVNLKAILECFSGLKVHSKSKGKFLFPIYMTDTMKETDIDILQLSVRSNNCLRRNGIYTIGSLCERIHGGLELKSLKHCGKTSVAEIMDNLFAYQFSILRPEKREDFVKKIIELNT